MKHGVNIPKDKRPAMARRAYEIAQASASRAEALVTIEAEFDVCAMTAINLISAGRRQLAADQAARLTD
jgi:hypothetical protein